MCEPELSNQLRRAIKPVEVTCEPGFKLDKAFACEPCNVLVPSDNSTWNWTGGECQWICAEAYIKHQRAATVACISEHRLVTEMEMEHGIVHINWQHANFQFSSVTGDKDATPRIIILSVAGGLVLVVFILMLVYAIRECNSAENKSTEQQPDSAASATLGQPASALDLSETNSFQTYP